MHKAGGIIGLIAGLLAVGAALFTLLMGGAGAAFDATGHDRIIAYGWWGVGASFMVITFGAVAIFNAAVGAFGLLAFSIFGAILGGSIVAIVLSLSLLGGILAAAGSKKWWPWAGLLAGIAMATPVALEMGDPRNNPQPVASTNTGISPSPSTNTVTSVETSVPYPAINPSFIEGEYDCEECHGHMKIKHIKEATYSIDLMLNGGSCAGYVAINAEKLPLYDNDTFIFPYKNNEVSCHTTIKFKGPTAQLSDSCVTKESEENSTCALLGSYRQTNRQPETEITTNRVNASCESEQVQIAVKKDFLNELMIKGGASSYARLWGLIGENESIDTRLAADIPRILPYLLLNQIAELSPNICNATLIFGNHIQYPIKAFYTIHFAANELEPIIDSSFTLPESGLAQVNLFQGMQKGVISLMFEKELAERDAAKEKKSENAITTNEHSSHVERVAPSFDCDKARTNVEHMICNSPQLAKADAAMGSLYISALQSAQDVKAFKDEGSAWLQQRNQCQDEACLVDMYQMRVNQLSRKGQ
jgi:uncharacterized protein YecT (DUF1311 family)